MPNAYRIQALGSPRLLAGDGTAVDFPIGKPFALLVRLALERRVDELRDAAGSGGDESWFEFVGRAAELARLMTLWRGACRAR